MVMMLYKGFFSGNVFALVLYIKAKVWLAAMHRNNTKKMEMMVTNLCSYLLREVQRPIYMYTDSHVRKLTSCVIH